MKITAGSVEILQINIGKKCNLSCRHCHVKAGPRRTEMMPREVLSNCLEAIKRTPALHTVDITGGAPEMNRSLEWFLCEASKLSRRLIVRTNLAILAEKAYKKFINIYASNKVELCGSLPCYLAENTDTQRGAGTYTKCIEALKELNAVGYGKIGRGLVLNLTHNPLGESLPGPQSALEADYKKYLFFNHGVEFNNLFCLTNIPVGRYLEELQESGKLDAYNLELVNAYNPKAVENVMCRNMVSVGWDGRLYDCDFNQMLEMPVGLSINNFNAENLKNRKVLTGSHCYACTAGQGSSCLGNIV